jgi:hypothetical protein
MNLNEVKVGQQVNVTHSPGDMFNHDFTGQVAEVNDRYVVVRDQDDDCFSCEAEQLSLTVNPIVKGSVVRYKHTEKNATGDPLELDGWYRVTAVYKNTVNVGPVFGGRGRFSGIKKNIPLSKVYEDEAAWYEAWTKSEAYQCM